MRISLYTQQWNVYITNQLSILFAVFSGNQVGCLHLCVPATGHKLVALSFGTHRCLALDFQRGRLIAARIIFLNFQCPAPQLLATLGNWEVPCNIPASWASSFLCGPSLAIVSSSPWCLVFLALPHSPCFLLPSSLLVLPTSFLHQIHCFSTTFQGREGFPVISTKLGIIRFSKTRHISTYQGWVRLLSRKNRAQEQVKESEAPLPNSRC